ncbi:MAG: indolepyruvate oxidoreductase subunit beta [Chloroflexia bacterium]
MEKADFLLVGVGGQGIVTSSDILADVGLRAGYDVKKSEVHGMAQRGGAVTSHVRLGRRVHAPLISQGQADFLVAFELLEALRWAHYLHPQGIALVNIQSLPPLAVTSGQARYPEMDQIREELARRARQVHFVEGIRTAQELGNVRVTGTVLLGALSALLPIPPALWEEALAEHVPARYLELNRQAFWAGRGLLGAQLCPQDAAEEGAGRAGGYREVAL